MKTIILADGNFPVREDLLGLLRTADYVICCDGSVDKLVGFGRDPDAIVGDMDSIAEKYSSKYSERIFHSPDQETNDLTKAVNYCIENGLDEDIAILGATGLREDHTLGNISLLADYSLKCGNISILTDYGRMDAMWASREFDSEPGQQVSIFSLTPDTKVTTRGLVYPLDGRCLLSWWQGTLNEAMENHFRLEIDKGCLIVYRLNIFK